MIPGSQTLTMNDQVTIGFAVSVNTLLIHFISCASSSDTPNLSYPLSTLRKCPFPS